MNGFHTRRLNITITSRAGRKDFIKFIPKVTSLKKLEIRKSSGRMIESVIRNCPNLESFVAMDIESTIIDLGRIGEWKKCTELKLGATNRHAMNLLGNLTPIGDLTQLVNLVTKYSR